MLACIIRPWWHESIRHDGMPIAGACLLCYYGASTVGSRVVAVVPVERDTSFPHTAFPAAFLP